jgi:hypothetical protein
LLANIPQQKKGVQDADGNALFDFCWFDCPAFSGCKTTPTIGGPVDPEKSSNRPTRILIRLHHQLS